MPIDVLAKMDYPGRLIILGNNSFGQSYVFAYGITGRSPGSQARILKASDDNKYVSVKPVVVETANGKTMARVLELGEATKSEGNPDLLFYDAMVFKDGNVAVSNGKQTDDLQKQLRAVSTPEGMFGKALDKWSFEPDSPHYTPRISGSVLNRHAGLHIIKRSSDGTPTKQYFSVPLEAGHGKLIATYDGANENPLSSFKGPPRDVSLEFETPKATAQELWNSLNPQFRVSVAAAHIDAQTGKHEIAIINKHEVEA